MKRRDFLKVAGLSAAVAALPMATKAAKPKPGIAVLFNYSAGHDRCILVSGGNWKLGDLIEISGVRYTVIEQEPGRPGITERGEVIWFPSEEWECKRLWLDRPLERYCPKGTEAKHAGIFVSDDYGAGDRYRYWSVEKKTGRGWEQIEFFAFNEHQPLGEVMLRYKHVDNVRIRPVPSEESVNLRCLREGRMT